MERLLPSRVRTALTNQMDERNFELYRLDVFEGMPESPLKLALVAAIEHKLAILNGERVEGTESR